MLRPVLSDITCVYESPHSNVPVRVTRSSQLFVTNPFVTLGMCTCLYVCTYAFLTLPKPNNLGDNILVIKGIDDSALECRREVCVERWCR